MCNLNILPCGNVGSWSPECALNPSLLLGISQKTTFFGWCKINQPSRQLMRICNFNTGLRDISVTRIFPEGSKY